MNDRKIAAMQSKIATQKNEIARLTQRLERLVEINRKLLNETKGARHEKSLANLD